MICKKCGEETGSAAFCPNCGTKTGAAKKKKKGGNIWGGIIACVFLFFLLGALVNRQTGDPAGSAASQDPGDRSQGSEGVMTSEELLAFDEQTWAIFKDLYNAHNNMMDSMSLYSEGSASKLSFYEYCEKMEEAFGQVSMSIGFGGSKYEQDYVSAIRSMALEDQMIAKGLMKYLDSGKTSDLAEVNTHIEAVTSAVSVIASNRGILLADAGLSDEEIQQRVEESMAGLE